MAVLWTRPEPLVLASTSTTRRCLLEGAGLLPVCLSSDVDERAVEAGCHGFSPAEIASTLATAKATIISGQRPDSLVIGADQVLECAGELLHKPAGIEEARDQIARLNGREHCLHAAVAIADGGRIVDSFVEVARLTMRRLDPQAIARYVDLAGIDRVTASVGGYQLEGLGIHLFSKVEGDHSTILGLPLMPLLARLRAYGCLAF